MLPTCLSKMVILRVDIINRSTLTLEYAAFPVLANTHKPQLASCCTPCTHSAEKKEHGK
jgi:hypothetical protein